MNRCSIVAASTLAAAAVACGPQESSPGADGTWVGTITTEGNVTTVINESGSVWGGTATLVEEASIGVEAGADEYMFGYIYSIYANAERIVVLDDVERIVRVYTRAGKYLFTVGGRGQGPGEYNLPMIVTMDAEGRFYVFDRSGDRISAYSPTGEYETSWPVPDFACCIWNYMHPVSSGMLWFPVRDREVAFPDTPYGARLYRRDGTADPVMWVPEIEFEPTTYRAPGRNYETPFSPHMVWAPSPTGGLLAGAGDRYRFEFLRSDDSRTVITRFWEPIRVEPEELEWSRRRLVAGWQGRQPGWSWDGAEMPAHRPAFTSVMGAVSGETWVGREVGSERLADCTEDPLADRVEGTSITACFRPTYTLDVFGADGRYLGDVDTPPELRPFGVHVDGNSVTAVVEDEAGTIMVKRYRLVLPGEEEP